MRFLSVVFLALAWNVLAQGQGRDLPPIVAPAQGGTTPVAITANAPEWQRLGEVAFNAHGRFRVERDAARAAWQLAFTVGPGARATVQIRPSGGGAATVETAEGTSPRNALLRAADRAVQRIAGERGFFAGRLTFTVERNRQKEVYISDLFLGEMVQVTQDRSQAVRPRWSPEGSRILYTSYFQNGFPDIYLIDLNNRRRVPFVSFRGTNTAAHFSPDGRFVAMSLSGEGNPEIYIGTSAGRQIRRLTRNTWVDTSPSWSPDGSRLVFASAQAGRPQLHVVAAAGGTPQRLATNISGYCAEPAWNPVKATRIAFTAAQGSGFQVAVYDMATRQSRWVTQLRGDAVEPAWAADGRHLIVTHREANRRRLVLVDTEGGKIVPLSNDTTGMLAEADYLPPR